MIYSVSYSVLQSCGSEVGEALSGSHPQFHFHLTKNTDSHSASFTPLHLAQSTSDLCSAGFAESHSVNSTAAKVRYSDESRLHHDAYFTKLTAFLCGLSMRWLNQLCMMYCVKLIVHLSVQRSERSWSSMCFAELHEGWRKCRYAGIAATKGRQGLGSA